VTVARGCIGNPFIFAQIGELLAGREPQRVRNDQRRRAMLRHWQLAIPFYGGEQKALPHARMHVIKYGQYHRDPVWARERLVTMRGPDDLPRLIDEVFADCFDEGALGALRPEHSIVPALQSCTE
jgi:tRNA-dihydrouridine synthase